MSRFMSGGPITSVENADRVLEKAAERAINEALGGLPLLAAVRGGTNPLPDNGGFYDSSDVFTSYQKAGEVIGVAPLAP